ncbi:MULTISPECIES: carbon dioxide-concentrating mechanism protein CcmK [unclassified Coleofasciculus]|uniref:carbon dioxide-concentrating mechanism protein CcmK n=1 Tax=unclassified Coleofasciculus TaxID=2692782 RepID=UPI00187E90B0|nr:MULTISPECIES: carbon dioxide-concentrating mechanism protein CcmK [unclassified Coleofasciculus]MBE9127448.1 carbon dioxide-concentrating mechanism protein CcmK [Coleofasciculus sp. LEGE 07081]MBE9150720.1 carbon dioxide-concentrating mechanism protein CcmK [Coleofasciculus sp. LEGE 07092]
MPAAVGTIEALGFPGILAAADAMVKAGAVTLVKFERNESGRFMVSVRGKVSEVKISMEAGLEAVEKTFGAELTDYYIIPNPHENIEAVLPIEYTSQVEQFREF